MPPTGRFLALSALLAVLSVASIEAQVPGVSDHPDLRAVQAALVRGDRKTAAGKLRALGRSALVNPDLAARVALLRIALAPPEERLRRYFAYAATCPDREEGLTALIAGLALAEARLRGRLEEEEPEEAIEEPEIEELWEEPIEESDERWVKAEATEEPEPEDDRLSVDAVLRAATPLVERWRATRANDPRVVLAHRLLMRCRLGEAAGRLESVRLPTEPIPVPSPLAEPVRVLVYRLSKVNEDIKPYLDGAPDSKPVVNRVLAPDQLVADLEPLPAGAYFVEVRSERSPWRHARRVVVSDLRIAVQAFPDGVAVLAGLENRPAGGVEITVRSCDEHGPEPRRGVTDADGLLILPLSSTLPPTARTYRLHARFEKNGLHESCVFFTQPASVDPRQELRGHVLTDRPLYRPGETVRGRVLARIHGHARLAGLLEDPADRPVTAPLAGRKVKLEVRLPSRRLEIACVTDAWGVAPFEIPLRKSDAPGGIGLRVEVERRADDGFGEKMKPWATLVSWARPARIDAFKRPPLLMSVEWPDLEKGDRRSPVVRVKANHPTGTPAAGTQGSVRAALGSLHHRLPFVLDTKGEARIAIDLHHLERPDRYVGLDLHVSLTAADGQVITRQRTLTWSRSRARPSHESRDHRLTVKAHPRRTAPGQAVELTVTGSPHAPVLLSIARETLFQTRVLTLDANGSSRISIPVKPEWWPHVFAAVTTLDPDDDGWHYSWRGNRTQVKIEIDDPRDRLAIDLATDRAAYAPGGHARFTLTTRDGTGRPVPATVAVAVVDQTLFALGRDRTASPRSRLRPAWHALAVATFHSPGCDSPWLVIGPLLEEGRVPAARWWDAFWSNAIIGLGGGAGGAFGGRRGGRRRFGGAGADAAIREDFRPTAFFLPSVVTDENGRADVEFDFPDDLTTWRVTLVAVGRGREGGIVRKSVRTEMPLSANLELPRLFRKGDVLEIPAAAHQIGGAAIDADLAIAAATGLRLRPEDRRFHVRTRPNAARGKDLRITAEAEGKAIVSADLTAEGEVRDRVKRTVPVVTRDTRRTEAVSKLVQGRAELAPRIHTGLRRGAFVVEVLGSMEAVLDKARGYLSSYPHGCVEQTTSKLTPIVLAIDAHRALGGKGHGLSPAQAHRFEIGMARLRDLQCRDGGFAWWPGGQSTDPGMSAIAFRFLARLQEASIRPEAYGLRLDADLSLFKQTEAALRAAATPDRETHGEKKAATTENLRRSLEAVKLPDPEGTRRKPGAGVKKLGPFPADSLAVIAGPDTRNGRPARRRALAAAEIAVARLLLHPGSNAARKTAVHAATRVSILPTGLAARLGLALARAGKAEVAGQVLQVLTMRHEQTGTVGAGCGIAESPACRAAALLELTLELAPADPIRAKLVGELLRRNRDGRLDHTLGTAAAVAALARDRATAGADRPEGGRFTLDIRGTSGTETVTRKLQCGPDTDWIGRAELPPEVQRVEVTGPESRRLLVTARVTHFEDGASAGALARPIRIERRLHRLVPDGEGGHARILVEDGAVALEDLLEVELRLESPPDLEYLVVECPVPAGFEAVRTRGLVIHDDRVTLAIAYLPPEGRVTRRFRMVPARRGKVVWPPARVEAMYQPDLRGRSGGATLAIEAVRARPAPKHVVLFTREHVAARRKALEDELGSSRGSKALAGALEELSTFPDRRMQDWLFEVAPERLGSNLLSARVGAAYFRGLEAEVWKRIRGDKLTAILQATGASRTAAMHALARALVRASLGSEAARRYRGELWTTPAEARLFGLTVMCGRELSGDPWTRLLTAERLLTAADQPGASDRKAVRAERWKIAARSGSRIRLTSRSGLYFDDLVVKPFADACRQLWRVGDVRLGNRETPERITALTRFLERMVLEGVARHPRRIRLLADHLVELFDEMAWSGDGSAEPPGHHTVRETLNRVHATIFETVQPDWFQLASTDPDVVLKLWGLATHACVTTPTRRADLVRTLLASIDADIESSWFTRSLENLERAILSSLRRGSVEAEAARPFALIILGRGPRSSRAAAWSLLSNADRRAIPTAMLVGYFEGEREDDWILGEVIRRGVDAEIALLRTRPMPTESRFVHRIVSRFETRALRTLDLEDLLVCLGRLGPSVRYPVKTKHASARDRLIHLIATGPFESAALARRLARPGDVRERTALLEVCARRGVVPETWDNDDPAAERYRTMLAARGGDGQAVARVRAWLDDPEMPVEERRPLVRALGRASRVQDVMKLGTSSDVAGLWREVLDRAEPEDVIAAWAPIEHRWSAEDVRSLLEMLPPDLAGRLVDPAIDAWIDRGEKTLPLLARAPAASVLPRVLMTANELLPGKAPHLLEAVASRPDLALPIATRLLDHPDATVREEAASVAYRITGEKKAYRDEQGNAVTIGPEGSADHLRDLRTRVRRRGFNAVEAAAADPGTSAAAAELLSREGVYLGR